MILDAAILLILVLFCLRSFRGGVQGEMLGAMGWIIAVLIAVGFSDKIGAMISGKIPAFETLSPYAAFAVILVGVRLLIGWALKLIPDALKAPIDIALKILSVAFGFIKGAFFISVLLLLLSNSSWQNKLKKQTDESRLYKPMTDFSKEVVKIVTENVPNMEDILKKLAANKKNIASR